MDPAKVAALRQQMVKQLGSMAVGEGGDPDVFSAELNTELVQDVTTVTMPTAPVAASVPDSDAPEPANLDE
jgi:hypothetical protein